LGGFKHFTKIEFSFYVQIQTHWNQYYSGTPIAETHAG
jgi:hypothetical protein